MGKSRRRKQTSPRGKFASVSRGVKRSMEARTSIRRKKGAPACPVCGDMLYSAEGGFYCGSCGWDDLPEPLLPMEVE